MGQDNTYRQPVTVEAHCDTWLAASLLPSTAVQFIAMTNNGSGYTSAPTVAFSGGGGASAAGTAVLNAAGAVIGVLMTNPGTGYTSVPTVAFSGGAGTGAAATAVMGTGAGFTATGSVGGPQYVGIYKEVLITVNILSVSGTSPTMTLKIQCSDDNGVTWYDAPTDGYTGGSAPAAISATGKTAIAYRYPLGKTVQLFGTIGGSATPTLLGYISMQGK